MALTFLNSDTMNLTNMGIQGIQVWLQLWDNDTSKYATQLVDMGGVRDFTRDTAEDRNELKTARNGAEETVKVLSTSFSETATFNTINNTDPVIAGLHEGNDALTGVIAGTQIIIRRPGSSWQCRVFVAYPGAAGTDSTLLFVPKAQIARNGETPSSGTEAAMRGFQLTFLSDDTYRVPAAVLASNDAAPYGVLGILEASANPVADLKVLAEALLPATA